MRHRVSVCLALTLCLVGPACPAPEKHLSDLSREKVPVPTINRVRAKKHLKRGFRLFDERDTNEAQREFIEALRNDPGLYRAHMALGEIYELEGDRLAAMAEYIAHTETVQKSRYYLDRMLPYMLSKMSRNPAGPREVSPRQQARAFFDMSESLAIYRRGKVEPALRRLERVRAGLPRAGLVEYISGSIELRQGKAGAAWQDFEQAIVYNPYFARRLLSDGFEERLDGLLQKISPLLEKQLQLHPSDSETSVLLAAVLLRNGEFERTAAVTRNALARSSLRWDLLVLKAAAHRALEEKIRMQQALQDLKKVRQDLSFVFSTYGPSDFSGLFGGAANELALHELAESLAPPARAYFLWRLYKEQGSTTARAHRDEFFSLLKKEFPADEFSKPASGGQEDRRPAGVHEFMGAVGEIVQSEMSGLRHCDAGRREKRANPSGRVVMRVQLDRTGKVAQVALLENTSRDAWLAYCMVAKVLKISFPRPFTAHETFKLPVMVGPEVDTRETGGSLHGKSDAEPE